jgi:hypothetical protein
MWLTGFMTGHLISEASDGLHLFLAAWLLCFDEVDPLLSSGLVGFFVNPKP